MKVVESINCFLLVGKGCRTLDNFVYYLINSIFMFFIGSVLIQVDVKTLPIEPLLLFNIQGLFGYANLQVEAATTEWIEEVRAYKCAMS